PLDLQLLNTAQQNGAEVQGLESLSEQGNVFSSIEIEAQVQFLLDTVCNYEIINKDFEKMKSLYLERDLQGLFNYSNQYSFSEEQIYKNLIRKLLIDRNYIMVDRMQSVLETGNAFIAIGAMHLPGEEGVLALLGRQGYKITSVY
ncbi:MAG: TraB/GumN family protein, partial [Gammaproteobacteria bacterium]|nr:TraB/GumN family protein [Gammaproteobacteria bacterium]